MRELLIGLGFAMLIMILVEIILLDVKTQKRLDKIEILLTPTPEDSLIIHFSNPPLNTDKFYILDNGVLIDSVVCTSISLIKLEEGERK